MVIRPDRGAAMWMGAWWQLLNDDDAVAPAIHTLRVRQTLPSKHDTRLFSKHHHTTQDAGLPASRGTEEGGR